jgi:uncharacterized membrane protein YhaH (DUF805 family)
MTLTESLRTVLKEKYADFNGRASRSEYWWSYLCLLIYALVVGVAAASFGIEADGIDLVMFVAALPFLVPIYAVGARRLHDTGLSGWWQLIGIVPVLGFIALLVLMARTGQPDANRFGEPPRDATRAPAPAAG